ncbi:MAG: hypothetical protein ACQ9ET_02155 [Nitrosomonadaceae bacterium]
MQSDDKYLVLSFIVVLLAWFVYTDRKISSSFLLYSIVFSGFLFALNIYTGGSLSLPSVISTTLKLILAYLVVRMVNEKFTIIFIKVIVFLAAVSLFGYLSDSLHIFDGIVRKLPNIPYRGYDGVLYIFRDTYHPYRNQSIFFEPGAYQAFLNAALFIMFFTNPNIERRRQWVYIAVLVAALITAFSTTGFMIFLCGAVLFLYKSELTSFRGKLVLLGVGIVIVSIFSSKFHEIFVTKINDYLTADEYEFTWSAQTRSSQLKADIRVIKKHIFGLGQKKYREEFELESRVKDKVTSNGVTKILAIYGLPFGLFIFGSYYWALRRMLYDPILVTGAFVMFMLFLSSEAYYTTAPICYVLIAGAFVFKHESVSEELQREAV